MSYICHMLFIVGNPVSKHGKAMQRFQVLGTVTVPILALLMLVSYIVAEKFTAYQTYTLAREDIEYG